MFVCSAHRYLRASACREAQANEERIRRTEGEEVHLGRTERRANAVAGVLLSGLFFSLCLSCLVCSFFFLFRAHIQSFIDKFRCSASRAALVQSRIKALAKMDALIDVVEEHQTTFNFPEPDRIDGHILSCSNVSSCSTTACIWRRGEAIVVSANRRCFANSCFPLLSLSFSCRSSSAITTTRSCWTR